MNVILVGFSKRTRTLHLGSRRNLYAMGAGLFGLVAAVFLTGYLWGAQGGGDENNSALVTRWNTELERQREVLEQSREESENHINALALRLGEMQAQVLRLNALGSRLTGMAGLDDGEFSFDAPPAVGGPITGSRAIEVPEFELALDGLEQRLDTQERQLGVLADLLLQRRLDSRQLPAGRPVDSGWMSSVYGQRPDPFSGKMGLARRRGFRRARRCRYPGSGRRCRELVGFALWLWRARGSGSWQRLSDPLRPQQGESGGRRGAGAQG